MDVSKLYYSILDMSKTKKMIINFNKHETLPSLLSIKHIVNDRKYLQNYLATLFHQPLILTSTILQLNSNFCETIEKKYLFFLELTIFLHLHFIACN